MKLIPLEKITIPKNRIRKLFKPEELEELAYDIETNGLYNSIVLDKDNNLISGFCRLQAVLYLQAKQVAITYDREEIPLGQVPYTLAINDDPITLLEIELHENIKRKDLTWQEKTETLTKLFKLRKAKDPNYTPKTMKKESGMGTIERALLIDKHKDSAAVSRARTLGDAERAARREERRVRSSALDSIHPTVDSKHKVIQGDALEECKKLKDIRVIVTDPPYGMGADTFGDQSSGVHEYEDSPEVVQQMLVEFCKQLDTFTASEAYLFMFCTLEGWAKLKGYIESNLLSGFKVWPRPLIWDKQGGMLPRPYKGPRYSYECILFASKGDIRFHKGAWNDVLSYKSDKSPLHPAQKPVELYTYLISLCAEKGDIILDPFCGSGVVFEGALLNHCIGLGIEKNPKWVEYCQGRIQGLELRPKEPEASKDIMEIVK